MMEKGILASGENILSTGISEGPAASAAGAFYSLGHGSTPFEFASVNPLEIILVGTEDTWRSRFFAGTHGLIFSRFRISYMSLTNSIFQHALRHWCVKQCS